jgi:anti-sigma B factor antagonist
MSDGGLHVSSRRALSEGGVTILDIKGDLEGQTADEMAQALTRLIAAGRRNVVLNLGGTDMISTQGLAHCVAAQKRLRERGGAVKIAGASTELRRIFDLVSLAQVIECYPEVRHAVDAFRGTGETPPKKVRKKAG